MKRFLTLAAAAALALTLFCACAGNGSADVYDWPIIGKWIGDVENYHYPVVTFNADGTYVWEWDGVAKWKDTGTYTYADNKVVMTISEYFEWNEEEGPGKWAKIDTPEEYGGVRTCPVKKLESAYMVWDVQNDWFAGDPDTWMYRQGGEQIKAADLLGTWESVYEANEDEGEMYATNYVGKAQTRLILSKDGDQLFFIRYQFYYGDNISEKVWVDRKMGTWTLEDGILTLQATSWHVSRFYHQASKQWIIRDVDLNNLDATEWANSANQPYDLKYNCILDGGKLLASREVFTKK